ncbi:MAG TPA: IS1595 family transposase [Gaiellaceae bacterium]|nr:IS1595 family transposase [Gaiellaceae bacterium]
MEFIREFPDDEACLTYLWRTRYAPDGEHAYCPRCQTARRFKRYEGKRARHVWKCTSCTQELSPTAGTIFHKSSTSLHLWFYAMWIMTSTRCGVSAKQLERELGVTYKTAWRMFNLIRNRLMDQDYVGPLSGDVELDETFVGGKPRESYRREVAAKGWNMQTAYWDRKAVVFGAVTRGGMVRAEVVPNSRGHVVRNKAREFVLPESTIYTDQYEGYLKLGDKYRHRRINHSARVYVDGDTHTQTIEGFWSLTKNGIRGVYHSVSKKHLQGYLNEYAWRYNHRDDPRAMFRLLLRRATVS